MSGGSARQRETALRAAELDLVALLPIPVVVIDQDDAVVLVNDAAETFLNVSRAMLRDRGLGAAQAVDGPLSTLMATARANGNRIAAYDSEIMLADGRAVRADIFITPLADVSGWLMISMQSRAVAALADRPRAGRGAVWSAIGVAAMLAHEIKNPLSGIRGAAQLLASTADADSRELTTLIRQEVDRITALIDRMEGFTDARPVQRQPTNIHAVLGHVRKLATSGFARDIPVLERYDPSLPNVAGDPDALVQIFLNVVKNAAEAVVAAGGSGTITLTTAYRQGLHVASTNSTQRVALPLEVCVIDTGAGAAPDMVRHMFEPFVSTKRAGGGLGLALVAKLVGDHEGVVEYERATNPPRTILRVLLPTAA